MNKKAKIIKITLLMLCSIIMIAILLNFIFLNGLSAFQIPFLSMLKSNSLQETSIISYTPTTTTSCLNSTCSQIMYSGVENVLEDGVWKNIKEARSLKNTAVSCLIIEDEFTSAECLDYNYTSITLAIKIKDDKLANKDIAIKVKYDEKDLNNNKIEKFKNIEKINLKNKNEEVVEQVLANFGEEIHIGDNSTTIILQDANTKNLGDAYVSIRYNPINYANTNYGTDDFLIARNYTDGSYSYSNNNLLNFNISSIGAGNSIINAKLNLYIWSNGLDNDDKGYYISAHHMFNDFNETNITWNTQPNASQYNATAMQTLQFIQSTGVNYFINWNVTSAIQYQFNQNYNNVSIYLITKNQFGTFTAGGDDIQFVAKEYDTNTSQRPYLEITYNIVPPEVNFVSPSEINGQFLNRNEILINTTAVDTSLANITNYFYNSSFSLLNETTVTTVSNYMNMSGLTDGIYYFNATACDTLNQCNSSETRNVTIDSLLPFINITLPSENSESYLNRNWLLVNITASDINLKNISIFLFNTADILSNYSSTVLTNLYSNFTGLTNGIYYFNATAYDLAGNSNSTETRNVTIDLINPNINFTNPSDTSGAYQTRRNILVNISINDTNFKNATIFLFNSSNSLVNSSNTSLMGSLYENFTLIDDDIYYFNATVYDLAGNFNSTETRNVTIDTQNPQIDYGTNTALNYVNVSRNWIYVNLTVSDNNFANITYILENSTSVVNSTTFNSLTYTINWTNLANGDYTYWVNVTDKANNKNSTTIRGIRLDIASPIVILNIPLNNTVTSVFNTTNFTGNFSDNLGIQNISFFIYNQTGLYNSAVVSFADDIITTVVENIIVLVDNIYTWFYQVFDYAGNSALSENRTLIVNTSYITISSPTSSQIFTQDSPTTIFNIVTAVPMDTCYWNENNVNYTIGVSSMCYQESANVSTTCGGLSTGYYANYSQTNQGIIFINYSKPLNALNSSMWRIKIGVLGDTNISIPANCWNYTTDILSLSLLSNKPGDGSYARCFNGTGWINLAESTFGGSINSGGAQDWGAIIDGDWDTYREIRFNDNYWTSVAATGQARLYEEAMYWNMNSTLFSLTNTTMTDGNHTISYWCNQSDDGTWRQSESVSFEVDSSNITTCRNLYTQREYTLLNNVTSAGTCLNIYNNTISIDGNNNFIFYAQSLNQRGISNIGYNNTILQNINFYMKNTSVSEADAIFLSSGKNHIIENIFVNITQIVSTSPPSGAAIELDKIINCTITNLTTDISGGRGYSIDIQTSSISSSITTDNISIYNSTLSSRGSSSNVVSIQGFNSAIGNILIDSSLITSASAADCVFAHHGLSGVGNLTITNSILHAINSSGANAIDIAKWNTALVTNSVLTGGSTSGTIEHNYGNLIVLNSTSQSEIVTAGTLNRQWYYSAYANNSNGVILNGVNITAYNNANAYVFNMTTPLSGLCYQETATTATVCGGLNSGLYAFKQGLVLNWSNESFAYDGDWTTKASNTAASAEYYVNYTIPQYAIGAIWETKTSANPQVINATITNLSSCWNYNSLNKLVFKITTDPDVLCYNGTGWTEVVARDGGTSGDVYEEAIYWNITGGNTDLQIVTEYLQNSSGKTYYTPHTMYASLTGYNTVNHQVNFSSTTSKYNDVFTLLSSSITLISPANNTYSNNLTQNFTANLSSGSGIANSTLYIYNSSNSLVSQITTILSGEITKLLGTTTTLINGFYTWFIKFFDLSNNFIASENSTIYLDTNAPTVTIVYPQNLQTYLTNVSQLNYTVSGTYLDKCWLGTTIVNAGTNFTNPNSTEGLNTKTVYCNTSAGNIGNSIVNYYQYTNLMTFNNSIPAASSFIEYNNPLVYPIDFSINITGASNNLVNATLFIYQSSTLIFSQSVNLTLRNETANFQQQFNYPYYAGDYIWYVKACDSVGLCNNSNNNTLSLYGGDITLNYFEPSTSKLLQNANLTLALVKPLNIDYKYCNFTLVHPSGVKLIDNVNGTKLNSNTWYSGTINYNVTGIYNSSVVCKDSFNRNYTYTNNYNVTYNLIYNPASYEFAAQVYKNETNTFNVSLYDDITSNINYSITSTIEQAANFTIVLSTSSLLLNGLDNSTVPRILVVSINASNDILNGTYRGNITFSNSTYNLNYVMPFIYHISPPAGNPSLYDSNGTSSCNSYGLPCGVSTFTKQGTGISFTYYVNNTGYYQMTSCNLYLDNNFANYGNWISFSDYNFTLNISQKKQLNVTFNPSETYISTGYYAGNLYVKCDNGDLIGNPQSTSPNNRPHIDLTILARDTTTTSTAGGTSSSYTPAPVINITRNESWSMMTEDGSGSYELSMSSESQREKGIIFTSTVMQQVRLNLKCDGALCDYITLNTYNITLPVNTNYVSKIMLNITLPKNITNEKYLNNIIAEDQFGNKAIISVNINVNGGAVKVFNKLLTNLVIGGIKIPYFVVYLFLVAIISVLAYFLGLRLLVAGKAIAFVIGLILSFIIIYFI